MAISYDKRDLLVNHRYDLVLSRDSNGNMDYARTNTSTPFHTLAQSLYIALQTSPGEFAIRTTFGANPKRFLGLPITSSLFGEIEQHIGVSLKRSRINEDRYPMKIVSVPIKRDLIAIRIEILHPRDPKAVVSKIDMMYSTSDNRVYPIYNAYGGGSA